MSPVGLQRCVPDNRDQEFAGSWRKAAKRVPKEKKKGFNTLIILGAWLLWKYRNACVFEGASPSMNDLLVAEFLLLVVVEFLLSSREDDTRSWGNFFWFISHTNAIPT